MKLGLELSDGPFGMLLTNDKGASVKIDAAEHIGGKGQDFRPMELFAGSLASCMLIDVLAILRKQRVPLSDFKVGIEGKRKDGVPSPFESIHLEILTDAKIDKERLSKNIDLTLNKYCSVAASLDPTISITYKIRSNE
jgi:putative redox protein